MNTNCNKEIEVDERGTIAVMKWIRKNNCPSLNQTVFTHNRQPFLIVSDLRPEGIEALQRAMELHNSTWDELPGGFKRLTGEITRRWISWTLLVDGHYYFATNY